MKVFLEGPRDNSKWKDKLIPMLQCNYINPTGDGWTPEDEAEKKLTNLQQSKLKLKRKQSVMFIFMLYLEDNLDIILLLKY